MRWNARFVAILLVVCAATFGLTSAALAAAYDNIYPTTRSAWVCGSSTFGGIFCLSDESSLTVFKQTSLTATGKARIDSTLSNEYNPTDLVVVYVNPADYDGPNYTDVIYQQSTAGFAGTSWDAYSWCSQGMNASRCHQHYVRFEFDTFSEALACHETGHAVGLTHGSGASQNLSNTDSRLGCMRTPTASGYTDLKTDQVQNINAVY